MLQRYQQLIPVLFVAICSLVTIVTAIQGNVLLAGESYDFAPTPKHYGGMVAIGLMVAAYFRFRPFYKYVLAAIFLLAMFKTLLFTPLDFHFEIGSEDSRLQLDSVALAFGLLVYWTNASKINTAVIAALKPSEEKARQLDSIEVEEFKDRFSRKTSEELTQIVTANSLVPSAVAAARQLLKERQ
ncbi:hypothetical protein GCM10022409_04260 [Hymenobacter glaciei]|uniref:Uncharacterized protein n=1 Tax=Hymenobacter glaciei TaxID=877209 RepID=A0ABP7TAT7_9BACT